MTTEDDPSNIERSRKWFTGIMPSGSSSDWEEDRNLDMEKFTDIPCRVHCYVHNTAIRTRRGEKEHVKTTSKLDHPYEALGNTQSQTGAVR